MSAIEIIISLLIANIILCIAIIINSHKQDKAIKKMQTLNDLKTALENEDYKRAEECRKILESYGKR